MQDTISVRIDQETKERLERLAGATARTKSFLVTEAIKEYLEVNEWQIRAIEEGIREADAGRLTPHGEVKRKWEAKLAHIVD